MEARALMGLLAALLAAYARGEACRSSCSASSFPHCGAWVHRQSVAAASGVYRLPAASLNLSCSVNALPEPAGIQWLFQPKGQGAWRELHCSSLKEVVDCAYNAHGEHRTTSTCVLRLEHVNQTAAYKCASKGGREPVSSPNAEVEVYGIQRLEPIAEGRRLRAGESGEVGVTVCAHPAPRVSWLNARSGRVLDRDPGYQALPLHPLYSAPNASHHPASPVPYCHQARLLISRVSREDRSVEAVVTTPTHRRAFRLAPRVYGSHGRRPALSLLCLGAVSALALRF